MSAANAARQPPETEAERVYRLHGLTPPRDASAIGRGSSTRPQRSAARAPLGLAPVGDDEDEKDDPLENFTFGFQNGAYKGYPEAPLRSDWAFHFLDRAGAALLALHIDEFNDLQDRLKRKFDGVEAKFAEAQGALRNELGSLRNELKAVRLENQRLQLLVENQRAPKPASRARPRT
jgi:hypothetical protein